MLKLKVTFKVCDLPTTVWYIIFTLIKPNDLQTLLCVNHRMRHCVLSHSPRLKQQFPSTRPNYLEVEIRTTNVLVLSSRYFSFEWGMEVFNHFYNVETLEVITTEPGSKLIKRVCAVISQSDNVKNIIVPSKDILRWKRYIDKSVSVSGLPVTYPFINNAAEDPIPTPYNSPYTCLIECLNIYRKSVLEKFNLSSKFNQPTEPLSLNGIMILSNKYGDEYNMLVREWESHVLRNVEILTKDALVPIEEVTVIADYVNQVAESSKKSLATAKYLVQVIKSGNCGSESISSCIQTLENILNKITYTWNPLEMSEDTLNMSLFDPVFNHFVDKISHSKYHGADHELFESRKRKLEQATFNHQSTNDIRGRKPDRSIEVLQSHTSYKPHVLLVEIKTQYQARHSPDLVKLCTELKDCIDIAIKNGMKRDRCFAVGLLVEGRECTLFVACSPEKHFYPVTEVSSFYLPTCYKDLGVLKDTVLGLCLCRNLVLRYIGFHLDQSNFGNGSEDVRLNCASPKRHIEYYV